MRCTVGLLIVAFLLPTVTANPGFAPADHDHPDPGVSASFPLFPQHGEVVSALRGHADHPWVTLHELGASSSGEPILLAEVVRDDSAVPREERVVTLLLTQQHGNEPAGTPAVLALLDDLLSGSPLADQLHNQVLLVLPMANPDGAAEEQRHNARGTDLNRDHIGLYEPETQAIHRALQMWDVHVAMDHHEYGGQGLGNPAPVRVYDYDLTTLFPVHESVREATLDKARALMYDGIWPAAEAAGYSANEYGEQTVAGMPVQQLAGGPDPGILRNNFGLHNIAGLLVETRIDAYPNPFHDAERRIDIHRVVMDATLEYASAHAQGFMDAKRASERANTVAPLPVYVEGESTGRVPTHYLIQDFDRLGLVAGLQGFEQPDLDGEPAFATAQAKGGLLSATFNPASSRAEGRVILVDIAQTSYTTTYTVPVPGVGALGLALAALALVARRGRV